MITTILIGALALIAAAILIAAIEINADRYDRDMVRIVREIVRAERRRQLHLAPRHKRGKPGEEILPLPRSEEEQ